jgi:hypothetical protein
VCSHPPLNPNLGYYHFPTTTVEVVYDTFPGTTTRAAHEGSLLEGLRLSTLKLDEYGDLRGLGHRSIIPYVYGESCCITVCVLFNSRVELA